MRVISGNRSFYCSFHNSRKWNNYYYYPNGICAQTFESDETENDVAGTALMRNKGMEAACDWPII